MKARQRIYKKRGGRIGVDTGARLEFKFAHQSRYWWKFHNAARFELWRVDGRGRRTRRVRRGPKVSYCLRDLTRTRPNCAAPLRAPFYPACSTNANAERVTLGTSIGWADIYPPAYAEQWIDVTGLRGCFAYVHTADPERDLRVQRGQQRGSGDRPAAVPVRRAPLGAAAGATAAARTAEAATGRSGQRRTVWARSAARERLTAGRRARVGSQCSDSSSTPRARRGAAESAHGPPTTPDRPRGRGPRMPRSTRARRARSVAKLLSPGEAPPAPRRDRPRGAAAASPRCTAGRGGREARQGRGAPASSAQQPLGPDLIDPPLAARGYAPLAPRTSARGRARVMCRLSRRAPRVQRPPRHPRESHHPMRPHAPDRRARPPAVRPLPSDPVGAHRAPLARPARSCSRRYGAATSV